MTRPAPAPTPTAPSPTPTPATPPEASTAAAAPSPAPAPSTSPAQPLSLADCTTRACSGVVHAFKRAMREGSSATSPHGTAAAPAPAPAPAPSFAASGASPSPPSPAPSSPSPPSAPDMSIRSSAAAGSAAAAAATIAATNATTNAAPAPPGTAPSTSASGTSASPLPRPPPPPPPPPPEDEPEQGYPLECPPDSQALGRATWTFLHTMAAYYPEAPTPRQVELMRGMMEGLAEFYPCRYCAEHLREHYKTDPPRVGSGTELGLWLCGVHNEVNEMQGKPLFDCSRLAERWREGPRDGSCD